ncbi:MAG: HEPN domain-containing protein [Solirubrobacteraceae bacterium]
MPSPENRELAERFFRKACEDRDAVEILRSSELAADAVIGFHAQQAVEKFAKAALAARAVIVPRTHDLRFLMDLAASKGLDVPEAVRASRWLTPWSVEFRYGEDLENPLDGDAAVETIRVVEGWAAALLGEP